MTTGIGKLALCVLLLGGVALAQDRQSVIELAVKDNMGEDIVIRIDSKEQGFNLHELQLGESRALATTDGRPVTVTRAADSFEFDVDGRQISMPVMDDMDAGEQRREVRIVRRGGGGPGSNPEEVTIISPTPLDDATRTSITTALEAAGMNEVRFVDVGEMGPGPHGMRGPRQHSTGDEVRIVRKEVRVTN